MIAAVQNYTLSQGETLVSLLTLQLPGLAIPLSGSTTISSTLVVLSSTSQVGVGYTVTGSGIPANTIVASVISSTSITLSAPATATASGVSLTFGAFTPINLTGVLLLFSSKSPIPPNATTQQQAYSLPDTGTIAQGVYEFNWTETNTPALGQTVLTISETVTQQMTPGPWYYLVRAIGAPGLAHSSNILTGTITITQPPSTRIS